MSYSVRVIVCYRGSALKSECCSPVESCYRALPSFSTLTLGAHALHTRAHHILTHIVNGLLPSRPSLPQAARRPSIKPLIGAPSRRLRPPHCIPHSGQSIPDRYYSLHTTSRVKCRSALPLCRLLLISSSRHPLSKVPNSDNKLTRRAKIFTVGV